jgi:dipeptidyl-peptidase 4
MMRVPGVLLQGVAAWSLGLVSSMGLPTPSRADSPPVEATAVVERALPPIAERYRYADRFLPENMGRLILDGDMKAAFVRDGSGIVYRRGPVGERMILFLDLATRRTRELIAETVLAARLSTASGHTIEPSRLELEEPEFDRARGMLTFAAHDKRWTLRPDGSLIAAGTALPGGDNADSPDGRFRIIARDYNLIAIDRRSGLEVPLTSDGTRDRPYGRGIPALADILEQGTEDPVMPVSVRWSPDSRYILTWRLDTRGVERLSLTQENPPGRFYPRSFNYIYQLAGARTLPRADRLVVDVEAALRLHEAQIVPVRVPSESLLYPADPDMGWSNGKARILWTERGYGQLVVYEVDPRSGRATVTAREAVKPVVTVTSSFLQPAPEFGGELDVSERSGWAQLYLVHPNDPDGGTALTRGNWEVISIDHVDIKHHTLLITGVGREPDRNPYWRALYRVTPGGTPPILLTPEPLDHEIQLSADGRWAIDAMSSPTDPTRTVVRDTRDGHIAVELGKADPTALVASGYTMPEPFKGLAADGRTPLYGMIYRPANFDPQHRYPIIDNVYTGPTTTQVPVSWEGTVRTGAASVAQIGAIVVMIDGRGTSRRGQAFRLPAYQNLGEVGIDDHIAMIQQMAQQYAYMDTGRVGVYGGSAGGYDAARFILRRPTFFKVAVASSGNHDLRLDKAWWPEVSMGLADEATWERNSNMSVAGNLTGKLLLIHGDIDDNVPVTESLRLARALIEANRDVDLVILPNTTHRVAQPFFWRKFRDYFTRNLLDETPPPLAPSPAVAAEPNAGLQ